MSDQEKETIEITTTYGYTERKEAGNTVLLSGVDLPLSTGKLSRWERFYFAVLRLVRR